MRMHRTRIWSRSWTGLASILAIGAVITAAGCKRGKDGKDGAQGEYGEIEEIDGLAATITASEPDGDGYFDEGDTIDFEIVVTDLNGYPIDINTTNLSRSNFYIYGPLEQSKAVTCQNLLRTAAPNEYIHLTEEHEGLEVDDNVARYTTAEIGVEEPGTYRAVIWIASATETWDRTVVSTEFQIKTIVPETETVVGTQCAPCHLGTDTGQYYLHHSDVSSYSATGVPELDNGVIWSCKTCHNQDGYARTTDTWNAALPKAPDPLIRRVHGVHMGEELASPRNTHRMVLASTAPDSALPVDSYIPIDPEDPSTSQIKLIHGMTSGAEARVISSDGLTHLVLGHVDGEFLIGETIDCVLINDPTKTNWSQLTGVAANHLGTAVVGTSTVYSSTGTALNVSVAEGYFADYTTVVFPPDVRNCTVCHVDNSWREKPSQQACSACHDNIWWGDATATPEGFRDHEFEIGDIVAGVPGSATNIALCSGCHADSTLSIAESHEIPEWYLADQVTPTTQPYSVTLDISPPQPTGGYLLGTAPKIYVTLVDNATGLKVDPTQVDEFGTTYKWATAAIYVSGPRSGHATPVLTSMAKGPMLSVTSAAYPGVGWVVAGTETLTIAINGAAPVTLGPVPAGTYTDAALRDWLNLQAPFTGPTPLLKAVIGTGSSAKKVIIKNKLGTAGSMIDISAGTLQALIGLPTGRTSLPTTYSNDLRERTDAWDADPKVTWNAVDMRIEYQLDDVGGLAPGTYAVYADVYKTVRPDGYALLTFEVGTDTPDKYIATNCTDCHGDRHMHLDGGGRHPVDFSTDYCKNCHDWKRENQNSDVWAAYGADPIIKKVHGIHRGAYLQYPEKIYINNPIWGGIRFPQDVRNCSKCHPSDTTTGSWNTEPSRLACGSCHDSDSTEAHMLLQTLDPTPVYDSVTKTGGAWSGDENESCKACHGEGKEFDAKSVHKIYDPYVPPYPR